MKTNQNTIAKLEKQIIIISERIKETNDICSQNTWKRKIDSIKETLSNLSE